MNTASPTTMMLISREKNRYVPINAEKVHRGSFLTVHAGWLLPQVIRFIHEAHAGVVVDPFAGDWNMLHHVQEILGVKKIVGYDIDPRNGSQQNDSLVHLPAMENGIVITNPPYLANHSAKRKGVWNEVGHYFSESTRTDLYQIALDRCLAAYGHVVAIVPETFIRSNYPTHRLHHVSVIERALFEDTQCPVCIVCFGPDETPRSKKIIYRNEQRVCTLTELDRAIPAPNHRIQFTFNDPNGPIALRAVDLTDPEEPIRFLRRCEIDYEQKNIKESSRLVTFISSQDLSERHVDPLIHRANELLLLYRKQCDGIHLSPFKGNARNGRRRRRLDYSAARSILEQAAGDIGCSIHVQRLLF
jgi:hypothetical protein